MLQYQVAAQRVDAHGSLARTKAAEIVLDTNLDGRPDAFNPAELFLASIAACMLKGIERVTPMLHFKLRGVDIKLTGIRQDAPPKIISVRYELIVDTDETDQRLELLHTNVRKYGTIFNTVSAATDLSGVIARKQSRVRGEASRSAPSI
ncbi:MAG: OsmC family protein [Devosia nanyangense]|uniref:OsmC family protein n=1 Tax=Devosia nanyangense TaxID=1228055 RepID=A0A933L5X8_9HYPH|nr:OsmC family protein [Devosia nanyangense]